jgi:uncharacterized protein (DUF2237 family)
MGMNVEQGPLVACSCEPGVGCEGDRVSRWGAPTVCVVITDDFLDWYRARGIDLAQPAPELRGPGLKSGDHFCVGAARWLEAADAGAAPPVLMEATPLAVLEWVPLDRLRRRAHRADAG